MNAEARILVVDDDPGVGDAIRRVLQRTGRRVTVVSTGEAALQRLHENEYALVLCDLRLPDLDGQELIETISRLHPTTETIMITAHGSVAAAVEAIRAGAYDFLEKPIRRIHLVRSVERALERHDLVKQNLQLQARLRQEQGAQPLIGESAAIRALRAAIEQIAPTSVSVLLQGESGTGKEVVADMIHLMSDRADRRMVKISCAAIPGQLLESELFGYEPGAFTGATSSKPGKFEMAQLGTLFLDEIAEMDPQLQAKLLRVLQDGRFQRLGGTRTLTVDVRIIAATNADLETLLREGRFREDLYYRLNVVNLHLVPLRERREDIPLLASHFLRRYAQRFGKPVRSISPGAMDRLVEHDWPGNVRELENVVQRAVAMASGEEIGEGEIGLLCRSARASGPGTVCFPVGTPLREVEERMILETVGRCGGNREAAARVLGISPRTIHRRLGPRQQRRSPREEGACGEG